MPDHPQIEEFKTRVGFDAAPAPGPEGAGLVVEWPDPLGLAYFRQGDWQLVSRSLWAHAPGIAKAYWVLRSGEAMVKIEIAVSSRGAGAARSHLLEMASNTMAVTIPYGPGPEEVGDICIQSRELPQLHTLMWVYQNIFVQLSREEGSSLLPLAHELQALLEEQSVEDLSARVPRLAGFEISAERVPLGDSLEARARVAPEVSPRVRIQVMDPERHLVAISDEGTKVMLRAESVGATEVVAMVVDRATLLSSFEALPVEVYEP